jgi:hypothetical protein
VDYKKLHKSIKEKYEKDKQQELTKLKDNERAKHLPFENPWCPF